MKNLSVLAQHIAKAAEQARRENNATLAQEGFEAAVAMLLEAADNTFWRNIITQHFLARLPEITDAYVAEQRKTRLGRKVFDTLNEIKRLT